MSKTTFNVAFIVVTTMESICTKDGATTLGRLIKVVHPLKQKCIFLVYFQDFLVVGRATPVLHF